MSLPPLTKSLTWAPPLSDSTEPQGMHPTCSTPDDFFRNVPNLSDVVRITGTRAFAHGGYSDIWRGICWSGDVTRNVAIKIIRVVSKRDVTIDRLKTRISREVITWSQANHKNIMPFYGLYWRPDDTSSDLPAMVYPYCAAGTCTDYLINNPEADRMNIMCQVADGLIYLHSLPTQVVHGDIKACNVLMADDGTPMLADFGLSRIVAEISTGLTTSSSRGSFRWMAPELFGGVEDQIQVLVTAASDVWAFGCLCLEILTSLLPWASIKNDTHVMKAIAIDRRQPSVGSGIGSSTLSHILGHCWVFDPSRRPSMKDLLRALCDLDASPLHRPHCALSSVSAVLSDSPPQILNNDSDTFTGPFSDSPLFGPNSSRTKTPLARIPRSDEEPLFTTLLLSTPNPLVPAPLTPVSSDTTGATPYMDSLGLTPTESTSSGPSSGLVSRDEPLFDPPVRPSLAGSLPGPDRHSKKSREARLSNSLWPRTPSSGSSTLPAPESQDIAFRPDQWQKSDPSTPSSTHTRSSSRGSFHYQTPPRTESYHSQVAGLGLGPSPLSSRTHEGYASDYSTVSSPQHTPVTPNTHFYRAQPGSDSRRYFPNLSIPPPSPSPSSHSSTQSRSPSYDPRSNYNYFSPPVSQPRAWSPTSTVPRDFRPAQSTAIRITRPDGTPVILPSPVKERRS